MSNPTRTAKSTAKATALIRYIGARSLQSGAERPKMLATGLADTEVKQWRPPSLTTVLEASLARGFFVSGVFYSTKFSVAIAVKAATALLMTAQAHAQKLSLNAFQAHE